MKLFNSIKSMFNSSKEEDKSIYNDLLKEANKPISVDIFDISPNIYLACRASKICIGKTVTGTLDERMNYISKSYCFPVISLYIFIYSFELRFQEKSASIADFRIALNTYLSP